MTSADRSILLGLFSISMMYSGPKLTGQPQNFKVRSIAIGSQCRILTLTLKFRTEVIFSDLFVLSVCGR